MAARHLKDDTGQCVPNCFGCKLESVSFAPSSMGTRFPSAARAALKDPLLDKDREAYRRLRRNGEQPKHVSGSARVEALAESSAEITTGLTDGLLGDGSWASKSQRQEFGRRFDEEAHLPAQVRTSPDQEPIHAS
jgi:hypothetical protein